jgi:hypothetical protein
MALLFFTIQTEEVHLAGMVETTDRGVISPFANGAVEWGTWKIHAGQRWELASSVEVLSMIKTGVRAIGICPSVQTVEELTWDAIVTSC